MTRKMNPNAAISSRYDETLSQAFSNRRDKKSKRSSKTRSSKDGVGTNSVGTDKQSKGSKKKCGDPKHELMQKRSSRSLKSPKQADAKDCINILKKS